VTEGVLDQLDRLSDLRPLRRHRLRDGPVLRRHEIDDFYGRRQIE
jgi:hypothetical protein